MHAFVQQARQDLCLFFEGRLKNREHVKLFGEEDKNGALPFSERYNDIGKLLDACSNEAARSCWPRHLAIHYKLRVFHDFCFMTSVGIVLDVPCEETLPEFGLPEVASACAGRSLRMPTTEISFALLAEKCFPRTCAMRDFAKKAGQIVLSEREARKTIYVMACVLLGNFRHCNSTIRANQRRVLLQRYFDDKSIDAFASDVYSKNDQNQMFLFSAIREYLIVAVAHCPASMAHLNELYNWQRFTEIYQNEMDVIRSKHDATVESFVSPFNLPESTLLRLHRAKMATPHASPNKVMMLKKQFGNEMYRALSAAHPNVFLSRKYFTSVEDARDWTRVLGTLPFGVKLSLGYISRLLTPEGIKIWAAAGNAWLNGTPIVMRDIPVEDAINIHNFLVARAFNKTVRVSRLPDAVAHAQYAACSRRFINQLCPTRSQERKLAARWASCARICVVCSTLKNYVETSTQPAETLRPRSESGPPAKKSKRVKHGDGAIGFTGCVHGIDTGKISCKGSTAANDRSAMCKESHLVQVELLTVDEDEQPIGYVLCFGLQEYMLSPCCATLCARRDVVHMPDAWSCPTCRCAKTQNREHLCDFCTRSFVRGGALLTAILKDDTDAWQKYRFCKTHAKDWFVGEKNEYKYKASAVFAELQSNN